MKTAALKRPILMNFKDKNVFVFGGSSGIGLETAKLFAERGANVALFARNADRLEAALRETSSFGTRPGQKFFRAQVDVSDRQQVNKIAKLAVEKFGAPQIVINSAGRAVPRRFEEISFEQFDETMKINLYGAWNVASALLPSMKERGGTIVNVSSVGGFLGVYGYSDYAASKFALMGLSEVLRSELKAYNINVAALCPPDADTPGFAKENLTKPAETKAISEGGGLMKAEKVAKELLRGVERGDAVIIPGFAAKTAWFLKRHFPKLVDYFIERKIRKTRLK